MMLALRTPLGEARHPHPPYLLKRVGVAMLDITSQVFDFGSESVLTLHRIAFARGSRPRPLDLAEFYENPREDCLYIENFNRWLSRSRKESNQDLTSSSPVGFHHHHLPCLPAAYSPRALLGSVRANQTFHRSNPEGYELIVPDFSTTYRIDVNRDINGVGLVYFASFFSIIDTAILRMWQHLNRSDRQFVRRSIIDHKLCYLGNADLDSVLVITVTLRCRRADPRDEIVDVVIRDQASGRPLAVAGIHMLTDRG